jgi:hypothetical protein
MSPSHQTVRLAAGRHASADEGVCVMELASMLADEPLSDQPLTVSPTLAATLRGYNDGLDDDRRQSLKRYASTSLGTATGRLDEKRRRRIVSDGIAEVERARGLRGFLSRRLAAAGPYSTALTIGRRVRVSDDDELHERMLGLIDRIVAVGHSGGALPQELEALLVPSEPTPAGR